MVGKEETACYSSNSAPLHPIRSQTDLLAIFIAHFFKTHVDINLAVLSVGVSY
jgi:hypothetical protein